MSSDFLQKLREADEAEAQAEVLAAGLSVCPEKTLNDIRALLAKNSEASVQNDILRCFLSSVILDSRLPRAARMQAYLSMPDFVCVPGHQAARNGKIHYTDTEGYDDHWVELLAQDARTVLQTRQKIWITLLPTEPDSFPEMQQSVRRLLARVIAVVSALEIEHLPEEDHKQRHAGATLKDTPDEPQKAYSSINLSMMQRIADTVSTRESLPHVLEHVADQLLEKDPNILPALHNDAFIAFAMGPQTVKSDPETGQGRHVIETAISVLKKFSPYTAPRYAPVSAIVFTPFSDVQKMLQASHAHSSETAQRIDQTCYVYNHAKICVEQTFSIEQAMAGSMQSRSERVLDQDRLFSPEEKVSMQALAAIERIIDMCSKT